MLSAFPTACKSVLRAAFSGTRVRLAALSCASLVAACVPAEQNAGSGGARTDRAKPVQVALLVPGGGQAGDQILANSLVNAANLAVADLSGTKINLKVYQTGGNPAQASAMAIQAANEGAEIVLGPVFAEEANAAGVALASRGVNLLAFSNNTDIAGGNVFVLGHTFQNTAQRLASFAVRNGKSRVMIVHDRNAVGELGRGAIQRGVAAAGGTVAAVSSYEFSQSGVTSAAPGIARTARDTGAQALFFTADTAGALPLLSQALIDNGVDKSAVKFLGLTRWDVPSQTLSLPGLQGGWFATPDPNLFAQFQSRYQSAYGAPPHPIAGLAYDGIAAIGALARQGKDMSAGSLTQSAGFVGVSGIFRLRANGANERGLAIAEIRNNQVVVIDPAPRSFPGPGF